MKALSTLTPAEIQKEISEYLFFKNFPAETLAAFAKMLNVQSYENGELILTQGQPNQALYFLRHGELEVLVDGEIVSSLKSPGEILGEMSVINKSEAMASVRALDIVTVFVIQESNFNDFPEEKKQAFKVLMNQVLTQVLVLRLDRTNDRAKKFEATNKELQKTQENLKELNKTLENEIARRSQELVDKVRNISEMHLSITAKQMNHAMQDNVQSVDMIQLRQWSNNISEVVDLLKPVVDLSERQGQNHFRRVFLCDGNKKQQTIAKLALGGTGVGLEVFSSGEEMVAGLHKSGADLVLIDVEMADSVAEIKARWPSMPLVLMLGQDISSYLDLLKRFPAHPYFVSRNPDNRALTIKSLTTTVAKILNKDFFGFEKYLSWGAHVVESKITCSDKRADEIEKMEEHFKSFGVRSTFLEQAHTVAEEMLMNAIYDAPADSEGKPLFNHLSRIDRVELSAEQAVTLRYGTDGVLLAVSVTDPFGTLTKKVLQSYLEKNYNGEETGTADKGGAGKGLHMIVANSDFVVFNVKPGKKTEVISFFQLERNKDETETKPTFHLFF
ncbi:MAG: cyclic nucleotide-binding domain-containing protein [Bdellovibrio sp.]|nr:cyclic nucleotide-binding domain-containing protein [Bdellovibrio sp.]